MKINGLEYPKDSGKTTFNRKNKDKVNKFSAEMENSYLKSAKKDLKEMLDSIKKKGNKIVATKTIEDVVEYKKLVKEYLKKVYKEIYTVNKFSDTFNSRYYLTVDTVDEKLKELTDKIIKNEKDNISILNTIDEIQGLMVNIYR